LEQEVTTEFQMIKNVLTNLKQIVDAREQHLKTMIHTEGERKERL
jgi:hypothetical protein